jgi:hypothetical protein
MNDPGLADIKAALTIKTAFFGHGFEWQPV